MLSEFKSYDSWLEAPYHRRYDDYDDGDEEEKEEAEEEE